ncbi:MAG: HAD family hydrolase [Pirellulaceae bacterium]
MPSSIVLSCLVALTFCAHPLEAADPLPSWHDTPTKQAIVAFVEKVSDEDSVNYVPPSRRIATFDNDGTLWSEQPMYFQAAFVIDRVKAMAPDHPQWKEQEPFASVLKDDMKGLVAAGKAGLMQLLAATHAGMTVEEFEETVSDWIQTARHPVTGKAYTEMVYQPMLELLDYLRANGFKTYIVSGGGIEFMRPWVEEIYGIAPEQVVGSSLKMKYELRDGVPVLLKLPEIDLVDDKEGKPVGIQSHIGRRPIFAAGNSDGDLQMLEYTTIPRDASDTTPRFGLIVHHTDGEREFAYDRESHFGRLDKALEDAPKRGWVVVDMKADWKQVYRR